MAHEAMQATVSAPPAALRPIVISADQAEEIRPFGIEMRVLLGSENTGGTFSALLAELKPEEGPPPHRHDDRDEYLFILEGTLWLSVDGQESTAGPGTMVFVPRGSVHSFRNVGSTPARGLEWTIPGEGADYFRAVHEMQMNGGFNPERFAAINRQYATEFAS